MVLNFLFCFHKFWGCYLISSCGFSCDYLWLLVNIYRELHRGDYLFISQSMMRLIWGRLCSDDISFLLHFMCSYRKWWNLRRWTLRGWRWRKEGSLVGIPLALAAPTWSTKSIHIDPLIFLVHFLTLRQNWTQNLQLTWNFSCQWHVFWGSYWRCCGKGKFAAWGTSWLIEELTLHLFHCKKFKKAFLFTTWSNCI